MFSDVPSLNALHLVYSALPFITLFVLQVNASDNLPLLSGSLRTFQKHACDGEELRIDCPSGTVISISLALYGKYVTPMSHGIVQKGPCSADDNPSTLNNTCSVVNILKAIEEKCREQRICRLLTSPETFQEDPCPKARKYAEVVYKCRPDKFTNRVVCEGERLRLNCESGTSIAIYSASFGSVENGVLECPQPSFGRNEACGSSYSTETVMSSCHGRRKCSLAVDMQTFGTPNCSPTTRKHLKVTFTCVPSGVLIPLRLGMDYDADGVQDPRTAESRTLTTSYPGWARPVQYSSSILQVTKKPIHVNSTYKKQEMQSDEISGEKEFENKNKEDQKVVGFISEWISAHRFIMENKEKLILYVTVSLGIGFVLFLTVFGFRLCYLKSRSKSKLSGSKIHKQEDFLCDSSDFEPDERPPSRYPSRISVRRQDSDVQPRTPVTVDCNDHYS